MTKSSGVRAVFTSRPRKTKKAPNKKKDTKAAKATDNHEAAISELSQFIRRKYAIGDFFATDVTELCHHLQNCGLQSFASMAINPASRSFTANSSRKVREQYGLNDVSLELTRISVPSLHAESGARHHQDILAWSFADLLSKEFTSRPREIVESKFTNYNWENHPDRIAGEAAGDICVPVGLFADGAAWKGKGAGTRESVLCFYVNILGERWPYYVHIYILLCIYTCYYIGVYIALNCIIFIARAIVSCSGGCLLFSGCWYSTVFITMQVPPAHTSGLEEGRALRRALWLPLPVALLINANRFIFGVVCWLGCLRDSPV